MSFKLRYIIYSLLLVLSFVILYYFDFIEHQKIYDFADNLFMILVSIFIMLLKPITSKLLGNKLKKYLNKYNFSSFCFAIISFIIIIFLSVCIIKILNINSIYYKIFWILFSAVFTIYVSLCEDIS